MRTGWKIAIGLAGATAGVIGGAAFVFFVAMPWKFNPAPPAMAYDKPHNGLEAQRQDLDYFGKLMALDRAFTPAARAEAEKRLAALKAAPAPMDRAKLRVALLEIAALADNGHTGLRSSQDQPPPVLPLRLSDFSDGIYVMRVKTRDADALGARVEAVDGTPIETAIARLYALRGGTNAWRRTEAMQFLYQQDLLYGTGIARSANATTWTLKLRSGEVVEKQFVAYRPAKDEPVKRSTRWLSPDPLKKLDKDWARLTPTSRHVGVAYRDFDKAFRRLRLGCVAYLELKQITDVDDEKIADFLEASEADLAAHKPCAAIVDLRFNTGGDYTNAYGFAGRLPGLVAGPIYVLTSPQTFSAAITTTAFIKQAAPARVHILGEHVGDRMPFLSEGGRGCLPNYHLCFGYETGMHDYMHPCTDLNVCYWLNYVYRARVATFEPEETLHTSFADWNAGRDPVLDRALVLATAKTSGPLHPTETPRASGE